MDFFFFSVNTLEIFLDIFYNLKKKTLKNEPYSLEILKKSKENKLKLDKSLINKTYLDLVYFIIYYMKYQKSNMKS